MRLFGWDINTFTSILVRGRQREIYHGGIRWCDYWIRKLPCWLWRWRKGPRAQTRKEWSSRSWKRWGNRFLPRPPREHDSDDTLGSVQWNGFQTSDLRNGRRVNHCFKPPSLWESVNSSHRQLSVSIPRSRASLAGCSLRMQILATTSFLGMCSHEPRYEMDA